MSFSFIKPEYVDKKIFKKCVDRISTKTPIELHIMNDSVMKSYRKSIKQFLEYLIEVGDHFEEYECNAKLLVQEKKYTKWLHNNLETVKGISRLIQDLTDNKNDNKKKY